MNEELKDINILDNIDNIALAIQKGDLELFPELMDHFRPKMKKIIYSITRSHDDTEDVVQETFLTILEKIEQWQGSNFQAWIFRIAKNFAIDCLRRRKRNNKHLPRISDSYTEEGNSLLKEEEIEILNSLLQQLPTKQRKIIYLKHFQKMSIREIADTTQCAEGTVKATLYQTLQKLKGQFQQSGLMD